VYDPTILYGPLRYGYDPLRYVYDPLQYFTILFDTATIRYITVEFTKKGKIPFFLFFKWRKKYQFPLKLSENFLDFFSLDLDIISNLQLISFLKSIIPTEHTSVGAHHLTSPLPPESLPYPTYIRLFEVYNNKKLYILHAVIVSYHTTVKPSNRQTFRNCSENTNQHVAILYMIKMHCGMSETNKGTGIPREYKRTTYKSLLC